MNTPENTEKKYLASELISLLKLVRQFITDDSDMIWTSYKSAVKMRSIIDGYIEKLEKGNYRTVRKIEMEFLPTGNMQEHAISNGWSDAYEIISKRFDQIAKILK